MAGFRVNLDACVAGNPLKAWKVKLPDGETTDDELAPDREPPDDVWEAQTYPFTDLDAAKTFIRGLPEQTTTHVVLEHLQDDDTWELIFNQDANGDHLDDAAPGVTPPYLIDSPLPFDDEINNEVPPAPPVLAPQEVTP